MSRKHFLLVAGFLALSITQASFAKPFGASAARAQIDANLDQIYPALDALFKDIHAHPELTFQENRTAALLAGTMRKLGFTVTEHVGKTGIVAVYKDGDGNGGARPHRAGRFADGVDHSGLDGR